MFKGILAVLLLFVSSLSVAGSLPGAYVVANNEDSNVLIWVPVESETHTPFYAEVKAVFHESMVVNAPSSMTYTNANLIAHPDLDYLIYEISQSSTGVWDIKIEVDFMGIADTTKRATWIIAALGRTVFSHNGTQRLWLNFGNLKEDNHPYIKDDYNWPFTKYSPVYLWALSNI